MEIIESQPRVDLSPYGKGRMIRKLLQKHSIEEIVEPLAMSRLSVKRYLHLANKAESRLDSMNLLELQEFVRDHRD